MNPAPSISWHKNPVTLSIFVAGLVITASGLFYTLTITCFCPNGHIELCQCVTNGMNTRNMILILGAAIITVGASILLPQVKLKRVVY